MNWEFYVLNGIQNNLASDFLNKAMPFISSFGNAGILWIIISLVLLAFKKTRRIGFTCLLSLVLMLIIGNVAIKNLIGRLRPFQVREYVNLLIPPPIDTSYPSGHTYAAFAFATALFSSTKRWGLVAFLFASLIAFSRLYLYVHFPTDVLGGMVLGVATGILAYIIADEIHKKQGIQKTPDK